MFSSFCYLAVFLLLVSPLALLGTEGTGNSKQIVRVDNPKYGPSFTISAIDKKAEPKVEIVLKPNNSEKPVEDSSKPFQSKCNSRNGCNFFASSYSKTLSLLVAKEFILIGLFGGSALYCFCCCWCNCNCLLPKVNSINNRVERYTPSELAKRRGGDVERGHRVPGTPTSTVNVTKSSLTKGSKKV